MTDSKLISLLKNLSEKEFSELEKFVASPFFASGRNFETFFKVIKPFYPDFDEKKLNKEILFKKLYPGEKYNPATADNKLKIIFSRFYKLCMNFLIQLELDADTDRKNYYLLNQLRLKKLNNDFEKVYEESIRDNEVMKGSVFDFLNKIYLSGVYKSYSMRKDDHKNIFESSLAMRDYSIVAGLINCFKHESEKKVMTSYNVKIRYTLTNNVFNNLNFENLLAEMKKNNDRFYPYIITYHTICKMQQNLNDPGYFFQLKEILKEYYNYFGRLEKFAIAVIMESYCVQARKVTGDKIFTTEMFQIYKDMEANGYYKVSDNEDFNIVLFRNMVNGANRLNEHEWIENLITKHSEELHNKHREDMKNYVFAIILFGKGNFKKALDHISKIEYELTQFKMDVRLLLLKIHYELEHFEHVYSILDSTVHYLRNSKDFNDIQKSATKLFVKYLKELLKIRLDGKHVKNESDYLMEKIKNEEPFVNDNWILLKIKELT